MEVRDLDLAPGQLEALATGAAEWRKAARTESLKPEEGKVGQAKHPRECKN